MTETNPTTCRCVICHKEMENFSDDGFQPIGGLAFMTRGHYGSAYFDPMDATYLELTICDECVQGLVASGFVFRSKPRDYKERP